MRFCKRKSIYIETFIIQFKLRIGPIVIIIARLLARQSAGVPVLRALGSRHSDTWHIIFPKAWPIQTKFNKCINLFMYLSCKITYANGKLLARKELYSQDLPDCSMREISATSQTVSLIFGLAHNTALNEEGHTALTNQLVIVWFLSIVVFVCWRSLLRCFPAITGRGHFGHLLCNGRPKSGAYVMLGKTHMEMTLHQTVQ